MTVPAEQSNIDKIERFQSLGSGQYWRAKDAIDPGIAKGMMLLIQSIRWIDDAPHTIILRAHPSIYGQSITIKNGDRTSWETLKEHRFLLNDFLEKFEFEENPEAVRAKETNEIYVRAGIKQQELLDAQTNPAILNAIVADKLKDDEVTNLPAISSQDARNFIAGGVMGAIGSGISAPQIESMKLAAKRESNIAKIKAEWISNKLASITNTLSEIQPYLKETAACALAQTEETRNYIDTVSKGIESLDLYIGKDVFVERIKEGASAAKDIPLTFVQKKLLMDEELAVHYDIGNWFDFSKQDLFFKQLEKNPALVNQIFPTERCVLVMATTHQYIDYGDDPYTNAIKNNENRKVFLLVRDGDNLFAVFSPVESHLKSARLFPAKSDQDKIFAGVDGSQISFEDIAFTDKVKAHEAHALHYKRFLILMCGLDHREKLFGDFYDGPQSMHFISMAFQKSHCRFLHDDDGTGLLSNPDKRPSVADWARSKNKYIQPGSRIMGNWLSYVSQDNCPVLYSNSRHHSDMVYTIEEERISVKIVIRKGNDLFVTAKAGSQYRTDTREFNANIKLLQRELQSDWIDALCIDTVEPEELEYYIHHRGSRSNHVKYIQFFKMMLNVINAEREAEAVTRDYMLKALNDGNIGDAEDRPSIVTKAVSVWRAQHKGAALPVIGLCSVKETKSILDSMTVIALDDSDVVEPVKAFVEALGHEPVRLSVDGKANLIAYTKAKPEQMDHILEENPYLNRLKITKRKGGFELLSQSMDLLPEVSASEKTIFEIEDVKSFIKKSVFKSASVKERIKEILAEGVEKLEKYSQPLTESGFSIALQNWHMKRRQASSKGYITLPEIFVPIACQYHGTAARGDIKIAIIYIKTDYANLLYKRAPNDECRGKLRKEFIDIYEYKDSGKKQFENAISDMLWGGMAKFQLGTKPYEGIHSLRSHEDHEITTKQYIGRALEMDFDTLASGVENTYINPALFAHGESLIDKLYGMTMPEDYEVFTLLRCSEDKGNREAYIYFKPSDKKSRDNPKSSLLFELLKFSGYTQYKSTFTSKKSLDEKLQALGLEDSDVQECILESGVSAKYFVKQKSDK